MCGCLCWDRGEAIFLFTEREVFYLPVTKYLRRQHAPSFGERGKRTYKCKHAGTRVSKKRRRDEAREITRSHLDHPESRERERKLDECQIRVAQLTGDEYCERRRRRKVYCYCEERQVRRQDQWRREREDDLCRMWLILAEDESVSSAITWTQKSTCRRQEGRWGDMRRWKMRLKTLSRTRDRSSEPGREREHITSHRIEERKEEKKSVQGLLHKMSVVCPCIVNVCSSRVCMQWLRLLLNVFTY